MTNRFCRIMAFAIIPAALLSCGKPPHEYPAFSGNGNLNMVIEIPAGSNLKYEYSRSTETFEADLIGGKPRKVHFLPYPCNYGFIPSTMMDTLQGGDGDPLDILLISESLPQGLVVEVIPIGMMKLIDGGEEDHKIIAVPKDSTVRTINCTTMACFRNNYAAAMEVLRYWFTGYKGRGVVQFKGWWDEKKAIDEVKKWQIPSESK